MRPIAVDAGSVAGTAEALFTRETEDIAVSWTEVAGAGRYYGLGVVHTDGIIKYLAIGEKDFYLPFIYGRGGIYFIADARDQKVRHCIVLICKWG